MKTSHKLLIDKFIGNPIAYLLNFVVRFIGFFLRIDHSLDKPFKTIAISKYLGMGSIIQATPLIQTLKANYPDAKIIFITDNSNRVLLQHISSIDEILTVNDKNIFTLFGSIFKLLFHLWKNRPDVFINLEIYSTISSLITTFSLSTNRFGFFKSDKKYRLGLYTHMMYFNQKSPISEVYLQFARLLKCKNIVLSLDKIELNEEEKKNSELYFHQQNIEKNKYIVVNPNASDLRIERRWPAENFIHLLKKMSEEFQDYKLVLIGSKGEADFVHSISSTIKIEKVIDTAGKLSLVNLIHLIKNAALLVTNDTGPMHIGFSQGTNTVAMFGPCSPDQYGKSENAHLIYKNVYCSPCVHEFFIPPCKGNNQCMKLITVDEVWKEIKKALENKSSTKSGPEGIIYESNITLGQVLRL